MTFDDLLTDTFELATGVPRNVARQSYRYQQLVDEVPHMPHLTAEEVAEMMLLGEMIADRAFATLPPELKNMAKVWHYVGHKGQVDILNTLFRILGEESLAKREAAVKRGFTITEFLPHQYGEWGQGDLVPNCLGMSQILIGFARATGARHMLIDTLRQRDVYANEYGYLRFRDLLAIIEPYKNDRWMNALTKIMMRDANETLSLLADYLETPQSHALLGIRTDEEWWILDPYMKICCKDDYDQKKLDRRHSQLATHPEQAMTVGSNEYKNESIVDCHLRALEKYIPYLNALDRPRSE